MSIGRYILEGKVAVPCEDLLTWGQWMQTADRRVARTERGGLEVSTVFLGLDFSFNTFDRPKLFETTLFRDKYPEDCRRTSTWEEAEAEHEAMCRRTFGEEVPS